MRRLLSILLLVMSPLAAAEAYLAAPQALQAETEDRAEGAQARLVDAEVALDTGRYAAARLDFRAVLKDEPANQAAARGLAEVYVQTGDYRFAQRALEQCFEAAGDDAQTRTRIALARVMQTRGDYDGVLAIAQQLLEDATAEANADQPRADVLLGALDGVLLKGNVQRLRGMYSDAEETYRGVDPLVKAYRGTLLRIDRTKGRQPDLADAWVSAGVCYYWLNDLHLANDCWGNAVTVADDYHLRGNSWMARLFNEQQNTESSSRVNYSERTLRHNPNVADLRLRVAESHFSRWRSGLGWKELNEALKLNPNHPEALAYRAVQCLYTDQYENARKDYEAALKVNPHHEESLAAKALHGAMLGLEDVRTDATKQMLAVNPNPARFYEIIADGMSDRFRYVEALPLYDKAVEANPKLWTAHRGKGMALMNMGDDVNGRKLLKTAFDNDPLRNNMRTINLLTLLESYKHFERYESPDGRWRLLLHKSEARVLRDLYIQHLDAAWESMVRKYDFKPRTPITVEAFHVHADFEVRTLGITGLPALGACFGQLITLDSPSARPPGTYNWASTLRHEMDHVFQLQISNGQVPRWLAEGLSVYEEKSTRPEWERHMEDQLFMHYHMDDIPPVSRFNEWFRDGSKVLFAYYLGNVMLEFIDKKLGGMGAVREMLELFGQKKTPGEVFKAALEMEPEEFDRRFREYVRDERIAHLRMVPRISDSRVQDLYFRYEDGEATESDMVELALGYAQRGSNLDANTFLGLAGRRGAAERKDPIGARFHYVKAMLTRSDENIPAGQRQARARVHLQEALARGLEDFTTYLQMAQFAGAEQNQAMVLHWLQLARDAFPESSRPYTALYQLHQQAGNHDQAVKAAESWMAVDENNLQVRMWLIEQVYSTGANWDKMETMAEQAINVAPLDPKLHQYRGYALRRLKRYDEAVTHYEYVRRMATGDTLEERKAAEIAAILDIAATWLHADDKEKCRKALAEAKAIDPNHPRIKVIESELEGPEEKEEEF